MEQLVSASVLTRAWQLLCGTFFCLFVGDDDLQGFSTADAVVQGRRGGWRVMSSTQEVLTGVRCCTLSSERRGTGFRGV